MVRISYDRMKDVFSQILRLRGFDVLRAEQAATIFADNSCDGVYSHGLNRFPRVLTYIDKGYIDPCAEPRMEESFGALERWDGKMGMGCLNACLAMDRAMSLSDDYGVGCVAMRNTHHWMRGGTYGLRAARAGYMAICWTNTCPNLPLWGTKECRLGNNPLVMAFPHGDGPVVIDGALAQYSYGALEGYRMTGQSLPFPGGYDEEGRLTDNPAEILRSKRVLPIGFWKGSGYALVLDLIGAALSKGNTVSQVGKLPDEIALTQVFLAFSADKVLGGNEAESLASTVLEDLRTAEPAKAGEAFFYPGERGAALRRENLERGIPVKEEIWNALLKERDR